MSTKTTHPTKERVRDWMDRRTHEHEPPPSPEDVRRELGWDLVPENKRLDLERSE